MTVLYILVSFFICGALVSVETLSGLQTSKCECVPISECKHGPEIYEVRRYENFCSDYDHICCAEKEEDPSRRKQCGFSERNSLPKVAYRNDADEENNLSKFREFPWTVQIVRRVKVERKLINNHLGGGSLIHPRMVLTIAHKINDITNVNELKVFGGLWDNERYNSNLVQYKKIQQVIIHEKFDHEVFYYDIALLYLESPFMLMPDVRTICLPPKYITNPTSDECYITGLGTNTISGTHVRILKKVPVSIVPNDQCQEKLRQTRLGRWFKLHESFTCAGGVEGKDACEGDGGSPLMCPLKGNSSRLYQMGLVSWGIGCGRADVPGVYVNVLLLRDWIDEKMKLFGLNTSTYTVL